ncbi:MAG TPA: hypothetical protein DIU09_11960, partial [Hyphomonadaceae bacterium]|nr:hypothetical protein [Hyphomonadaceae bacterium]
MKRQILGSGIAVSLAALALVAGCGQQASQKAEAPAAATEAAAPATNEVAAAPAAEAPATNEVAAAAAPAAEAAA